METFFSALNQPVYKAYFHHDAKVSSEQFLKEIFNEEIQEEYVLVKVYMCSTQFGKYLNFFATVYL